MKSSVPAILETIKVGEIICVTDNACFSTKALHGFIKQYQRDSPKRYRVEYIKRKHYVTRLEDLY